MQLITNTILYIHILINIYTYQIRDTMDNINVNKIYYELDIVRQCGLLPNK